MGLKKVIACLKEFGFRPKIEKFEDKLIIQKTVCILDMMGFNIGYQFSLYIRGPYSPDLTTDLYQNKDQVEKLKTDYSIKPKESELITKLKESSNDLDPTLLEIMATYLFFSEKQRLDYRKAMVQLKKLKPFFSESKIALAISRAKQLFPPSEKDIAKMKKEFSEIEEASLSDMK